MKLILEKNYLLVPAMSSGELEALVIKASKTVIPLKVAFPKDGKADFFASIPASILGKGEIELVGNLPESFTRNVSQSDERYANVSPQRPHVHFSAENGWINDPNGLFFSDGVYHMYFQYNPFSSQWQNMSWGHATSRDLLHWKEEDIAMLPDEDGMIFSGSAYETDDSLDFFYTRASRLEEKDESFRFFSQRLAVSHDGGMTLEKKGDILGYQYADTRDPKVFRHEESDSYIMVLWTRGNEFGFYRSKDLVSWEKAGTVTLEGGWECPDLLRFGDRYALFTADGTYAMGYFDGYGFTKTGKEKKLYMTDLPYAAQSWSGLKDRVLMVPWLRSGQHGTHCGAMGFPTEIRTDGEKLLSFFARELWLHAVPTDRICKEKPFVAVLKSGSVDIGGHRVEKLADGVAVDGIIYAAGSDLGNIEILADGYILEARCTSGEINIALECDMAKDFVKNGDIETYSID